MRDRVPKYPGRVQLTPVAGQTNIYDMIRADDPTQAGDALNKANLLPDDVAAALGLTGNPQVKDALMALFGGIADASALANTKARVVTGFYTGTGTYGQSARNSLVFPFVPKFLIIQYRYVTPNTNNSGTLHSPLMTGAIIQYDALIRAYENSVAYGKTTGFCSARNSDANVTLLCTFSADRKTLYWYASASADAQLNTSGYVYEYTAIG